MRLGFIVSVQASALLGVAVARAEGRPAPAERTFFPVAVVAHFGLATPYGAVGLALDLVPIDWLGLEGGVGTNFDRPEVGALVRGRVPFSPTLHFNFGGGFSYLARYEAHEWNGVLAPFRVFESMAEGSIQRTLTAPAYFGNFECGGEYRRRHLAVRAYVGFAHLMNQSDTVCGAGHYYCDSSWGSTVLYLGMSFGFAP